MIIIFGAGISGKGSKKLLESKGKKVILVDDKIGEIKTEDAILLIEKEEIEYIVKSPGISPKTKFIQKALEKGIKIVSEIDIAYQYMDKNIEIISFTGTNGKTTTAISTYEMLKKAGFDVELGGNVGKSFAEIVYENKKLDYIILELSSYQLENNPIVKSKISGIINLTPDHLLRYKDTEDYYKTKFNIFRNCDKNDYIIVNTDDNNYLNLVKSMKNENWYTKPKRIYISKNAKGNIFVLENKIYVMKKLNEMYDMRFNINQQAEYLIDVEELSLKGAHNLENMLFLIAASKICQIPNKVIRNYLKTAKSIEHRMEVFLKKENTLFINDSKGTNVDSTIKAINSYNNIYLVCGGENKNVPLENLAYKIKEKVQFTYIYGENRFLIEEELKKISYSKYKLFEKVEDCIQDIKKECNFKDEINILYSPATSSFDQFENFEHRGRNFKEKVKEIIGE